VASVLRPKAGLTIVKPAPTGATPIPVYAGTYNFYTPYHQSATYTEMWNLTLQKEFGQRNVATLAYSGSHGVHLPINYSYNLCQQSPASVAALGDSLVYNSSADSPYCPGSGANLYGVWGVVYPGWWGLSSSVYHSLQATFERRASKDLTVISNFTWGKLIDDSSSDWGGFGALDVLGTDFYNRRADRSISQGDIPAHFKFSPIYELPFGPGKRWANHGIVGQVAGGFRVSAIYNVSSGEPVGVLDANWSQCTAAWTIGQRPNLVGRPSSGFKRSYGRHDWIRTNDLFRVKG
jgi:hypothetical protein